MVDAIERRDLVVFSPREVERFLDVSSRNAYRILDRMLEKGLVERLARGRYVLDGHVRDAGERRDRLEPRTGL